jgi:hypothetical protein
VLGITREECGVRVPNNGVSRSPSELMMAGDDLDLRRDEI